MDQQQEAAQQKQAQALKAQHESLTCFQQQIRSDFSDQSQHTQTELERLTNATAELKTDIEQQLHAHIQTVQKKTSDQDAAAQRLHDELSNQLKKFQQAMGGSVEQKMQELRGTVKSMEQQQEAIQQKQTQELKTKHESLERNLQHLETALSSKVEALQAAEVQLTTLQAEQQKSASTNRLAIGGVACLALVSLAWQLAQHFALI